MSRNVLLSCAAASAVAMTIIRPWFPHVGHSGFMIYMSLLHVALGYMIAKVESYWRDRSARTVLLSCIIIPSIFQSWWFVTNS